MTAQQLLPPTHITWRRFAYSADLVDLKLGDLVLPRRWRSSIAVYAYAVPRPDTELSYPDGRVVYLRLSCSITGWTPSEDLDHGAILEALGDDADDWQRGAWEVIAAHDWAETYWPCLGAIAELAVYPSPEDEVEIDRYPFVYDFEPKKRELYETRTETGEVLSGTTDQLHLEKSATSMQSTEESDILTGVNASFGIGPVSFGGGASGEWGTRKTSQHQSVETRTTDTSREKRETLSHSTTFNQMYQLFTGYHLGTNRALFVISPRPHIVSGNATQLENNLINGERRLEGVQEMVAVVFVPDGLRGICVQANLDTGHAVEFDEFDRAPGGESLEGRPLVVTRRVVQNCAVFNEEGGLDVVGAPTPPPEWPPTLVAAEDTLRMAPILRSMFGHAGPGGGQVLRAQLADEMNAGQARLRRSMLKRHAARRSRATSLFGTKAMRALVRVALSGMRAGIDVLVKAGRISDEEATRLRSAGVNQVGDLFSGQADDPCRRAKIDPDELRERLTRPLLDPMCSRPGR